jgi:hypothetical protein
MWAVKAEAHDGQVYTLRDGFPSRRAAESFKLVAARWKRFWVEPMSADAPIEEKIHGA